jgi:RNA polymerase sigma-70 factor, ECF subfamily
VIVEDNDRIAEPEFEDFYRQYYGRVLAFALRRASRSAADDVAAETFIVAWRRRGEIVGDPLPWLYGVARRVLANQLRGARRADALAERAILLAECGGTSGESPIADTPIGIALASLRERDREALILTAWDELAPAQAARVLGCSAAAFRVRLHRAKKRLAQALEEAEADERPTASKSANAATEPKGSL